MEEFLKFVLELIKIYGIQLGIIGAVIASVSSLIKFTKERSRELYWKEFEVFHNLIKELVEGASENKVMFLDRQIAIVFELRNFQRYYPVSLRILQGLRETWSDKIDGRLIKEINLTIKCIERSKKYVNDKNC